MKKIEEFFFDEEEVEASKSFKLVVCKLLPLSLILTLLIHIF